MRKKPAPRPTPPGSPAMTQPLNRRQFLGSSAAAALPLAAAEQPKGSPGPAPVPGLSVREFEPVNLEMPFATLDQARTPTERFFVRCHFAQPSLDAGNWQLQV